MYCSTWKRLAWQRSQHDMLDVKVIIWLENYLQVRLIV